MTPDTKRLRELLREAGAQRITPAPWSLSYVRALLRFGRKNTIAYENDGDEFWEPDDKDAEFVVLARAALPALLDEIDRLRLAIRKAHTLIDKAMGDTDPIDPDDPLLRAAQALSFALRDLDVGGEHGQ